MGVKRRDFLGGVLLLIGGGFMVLDGAELTDDEKDIAKETIAIFAAGFSTGGEPDPGMVADRAKLAIRAWRKLEKDHS